MPYCVVNLAKSATPFPSKLIVDQFSSISVKKFVSKPKSANSARVVATPFVARLSPSDVPIDNDSVKVGFQSCAPSGCCLLVAL